MSESPRLLHAAFAAATPACSFSNAAFDVVVPLAPSKDQTPYILHLRGPSGVGKTQAALALLSGVAPRGASLALHWHDSVPAHERIGMLFQSGVLVDELTVGANLLLAGGVPDALASLLASVGLEPSSLEKMPGELSGGMLRRAALAQLLCQRKRVIVLDEPFGGLDDCAAAGVADALLAAARGGIAMILISHRSRWADALAPCAAVELHAAAESEAKTLRRVTPIDCGRRALARAGDYILLSAPLIVS